jgi:hypothetical protein
MNKTAEQVRQDRKGRKGLLRQHMTARKDSKNKGQPEQKKVEQNCHDRMART